jgi:hypothetical protein
MDRVLYILGHMGNHGSKLILIELIGHSTTLLALTHKLGELEFGLQFRITLAASHVRHGGKRAGLDTTTERAMRRVGLHGVVAENGVYINGGSRPAVARGSGNSGLLVGQRIDLRTGGNQVGQLIDTGTGGLFILDALITRIVVDTCELINLKTGGHHSLCYWRTIFGKHNRAIFMLIFSFLSMGK